MSTVDSLWAAAILWAGSHGAEKIDALPSTWTGRIEASGDMGPFDVEINGHPQDVKGIPAFGILIGADQIVPVAIATPGGTILRQSAVGGEDYDGLLAYFKSQRAAS